MWSEVCRVVAAWLCPRQATKSSCKPLRTSTSSLINKLRSTLHYSCTLVPHKCVVPPAKGLWEGIRTRLFVGDKPFGWCHFFYIHV